ncbi:predicted protein [Uncinocarpus reesii 1704]|uniref:Uncharacterized protein n=1 Tax=Uncinocarpus reesii (strain UAMH 1704) TaxID=336963 RepID=C4JM65_UNCRE|nr:uncharacterized protein UREG_03923 [Uncinocarpus reesii 1704]EEP79077.1 predicted protein [Uncinocarpus reesii 1704]
MAGAKFPGVKPTMIEWQTVTLQQADQGAHSSRLVPEGAAKSKGSSSETGHLSTSRSRWPGHDDSKRTKQSRPHPDPLKKIPVELRRVCAVSIQRPESSLASLIRHAGRGAPVTLKRQSVLFMSWPWDDDSGAARPASSERTAVTRLAIPINARPVSVSLPEGFQTLQARWSRGAGFHEGWRGTVPLDSTRGFIGAFSFSGTRHNPMPIGHATAPRADWTAFMKHPAKARPHTLSPQIFR